MFFPHKRMVNINCLDLIWQVYWCQRLKSLYCLCSSILAHGLYFQDCFIIHHLGIVLDNVISLTLLRCSTRRLGKSSGQKKKKGRQAQELAVKKLWTYWKLFCSYRWTRGGWGNGHPQGLLLAPEAPCSGGHMPDQSQGHLLWPQWLGQVWTGQWSSICYFTNTEPISFLPKMPPISPEVTFFPLRSVRAPPYVSSLLY